MEIINQKIIDDVHNVRQYTEDEYQQFINASGDPDDDTGEPDTIEPTSEDESGVPATDLPKFRQLVRAKKLALKAQYGRGRLEIIYRRVWGVNIPAGVRRIHGWRYYWKHYKFHGGMAQLKLQAQTPEIILPPPPPPPPSEPSILTTTGVKLTPSVFPTGDTTGDTKRKELGATWIPNVPNYVPVIAIILILGGISWASLHKKTV